MMERPYDTSSQTAPRRNAMKRTVLPIAILLLLMACPVFGQENDSAPVSQRAKYNDDIITNGIIMYYCCHAGFPVSFDALLSENWIPSNLINDTTGQPIQLDPEQPSPGDYGIKLGRHHVIEVIQYTSGDPLSVTWDPRYIGSNRLNVPINELRPYVMITWAQEAVECYQAGSGNLPSSIDDLKTAQSWPFEGIKNAFTGEDMKFDAPESTPGDMTWTFEDGKIHIQYWPEAGPDGKSTAVEVTLPSTDQTSE
jgi:hypothetical protein